jgi:phosphatidate cytidylyltransferase
LNAETRARLLGYEHAFDHPVTVAIALTVAVALLIAPLIILLLVRLGRVGPAQHTELMQRYRSWLVLIPAMGVPILLGAAWTILGVAILSLLCYREYARATGLFREKFISLLVVVGILAVTFAVADHWYGFFVALFPLSVGLIVALATLADRPQGYIQRVALGVLGFVLFGSALGHLGYMANDRDYRPIMMLLLLAVEANDVFAYIAGKTFGRRKLAPHTSPNKTIGGALGALILTTALVMVLGHYVFAGPPERQGGMQEPLVLLTLGVIISVVGQLGDLVLSSIKRDLGLKDMGATIPGHGGLLDRFDSLLLAAPAVFHYVGYIREIGFGLDQTPRIFTGG